MSRPRAKLCTLLAFAALFACSGGSNGQSSPEQLAGANPRAEALIDSIRRAQPGPFWPTRRQTTSRLVKQSPGQIYTTGLGAAWYAEIASEPRSSSFLMWDLEGNLIEFALDTPIDRPGPDFHSIPGVPNLQQFPLTTPAGARVASGCVPTSAASLIGHWIKHGLDHWGKLPLEQAGLEEIALRLRQRLPMTEFRDEAGYSADHLTLSGASPEELAVAIRKDAADHGVHIRVELAAFSFTELAKEIEAGRPVLLSCTLRLPHKPHLSWGHEVTGVGWASIEGQNFVGICDNFFPVRHPETIRWIREDAFESILTVIPQP